MSRHAKAGLLRGFVPVAAAQHEHDALTGRQRETLLTGSDADLLKLDTDKGAAGRLLDRLRAIAEELEARLTQALEAESDAARARRRAALLAERDSKADRLRAEYPKLAAGIVALIEECARPEIEIDEFNKAAAPDKKFDRLNTPFAIARPRRARKCAVQLFISGVPRMKSAFFPKSTKHAWWITATAWE